MRFRGPTSVSGMTDCPSLSTNGSSGRAHRAARTERGVEDAADSNTGGEPVAADRVEADRGDAAAVGAVGRSARLTWGYPRLEIGGIAARHAREHALVRTLGRLH